MSKIYLYISIGSSFFIIFFYIFYHYKIICLQNNITSLEKEKYQLNDSIYKINNKIYELSSSTKLLDYAKNKNYLYIKDQYINHV